MLAGALLLPAGCAGTDANGSFNPVDWWHGLEGGRLAEARPPPPNADAPYPSLNSVPDKPKAPDAAMHARVASALVADRGNAEYTEKTQPLHPAGAPAPTPSAVRAQGAAPADDAQPNAALAAASAPPPKPAPAAAAPSSPPVAAATPAKIAAAAPAAPMPQVPEAPPPPPHLAGVAGPPDRTVPTAPVSAPPPAPAAPPPNGPFVAIAFPAGSALVPADELATIKTLAGKRGASSIAVTGFGEAASSDPVAQAAALPLGIDRARAVAAELQRDGVPGSAIRIAVEAQGSGAAARLVN